MDASWYFWVIKCSSCIDRYSGESTKRFSVNYCRGKAVLFTFSVRIFSTLDRSLGEVGDVSGPAAAAASCPAPPSRCAAAARASSRPRSALLLPASGGGEAPAAAAARREAPAPAESPAAARGPGARRRFPRLPPFSPSRLGPRAAAALTAYKSDQ